MLIADEIVVVVEDTVARVDVVDALSDAVVVRALVLVGAWCVPAAVGAVDKKDRETKLVCTQ